MKQKITEILLAVGFDADYFKQQALQTGFKKRERTLKAIDFVIMLLLNCSKKVMSYNVMAASLATAKQPSVTKQALHPVMNTTAFMSFVQKVFADILNARFLGQSPAEKPFFRRIIIHDSSVIGLPQRLFKIFGGVKNATTQFANARIQFVLDLLSHHIESYKIGCYKENDQKAAPQLLVKKGFGA